MFENLLMLSASAVS